MCICRKKGGQGVTNLEMVYETETVSLNSYLQSSGDRMLHAVLQHEKKKKLHSVVKESRKFKTHLNMAPEEIEINTKPTKAAKENTSLEDMKKGWREKLLHGKYPLMFDNVDLDRATTHQAVEAVHF